MEGDTFPEDLSTLTYEELDTLSRQYEEKTPLQHAGQFAVSAYKGLAGTVPTMVDLAGLVVPGIDRKDAHAYAQGMRKALEEGFSDEPGLEDSLTAAVGGGVGSGAAFLLGGGAVQGGARALGAGAKLMKFLNYATPAGLGAALQAPGQFYEAEAHGASETDKWIAFTGGLGIGATEVVGIGSILRRIDQRSGGTLRKLLIDGAKESFEEGGQEWLQTVLGNTLAKNVYDEEREVLEGALKAGTAGFLSGGLLSMAASGAQGLGPEADIDVAQLIESDPSKLTDEELDQVYEALNEYEAGDGVTDDGTPAEDTAEEGSVTADTETDSTDTEETLGDALGFDEAEPVSGEIEGAITSQISEVTEVEPEAEVAETEEDKSEIPVKLTSDSGGEMSPTKETGESSQDVAPVLPVDEGASGPEGLVPNEVDGLKVRAGSIPNTDSISASLDPGYRVLGVQEVSFSEFDEGAEFGALSRVVRDDVRRVQELQKELEASGEIAPLIVVRDSKGAYILEGGHRADALFDMGKTSFPALVVEAGSDPTADIGIGKLPTEAGLFGEQVKPKGKRRDTTPTETAIEGQLFDTQPGDLPGQTTIGEAIEADPGRSTTPPKPELTKGQKAYRVRKTKLVEGHSGMVPKMQAMGGVRYDADLAAVLEGAGDTIKGFGKPMHPKGVAKGLTFAEFQESLVEDGWFPGRTADEIHPNEVLELIENNARPPEALADSAEKAQREYEREQQAMAEHYEAIREEQFEDVEDVEGDDGVPFFPADAPTQMQPAYPDDSVSGSLGPPAKIGGGLEGRLAPVDPPRPGETVSAPQVIQALSKIVEAGGTKVPIRWSRMGKAQALGFFQVRPEVIRVLVANDIKTAAHEVGHALEKAVYGWPSGGPWKNPRIVKKMQQELMFLGKRLYGNRKPKAGMKREGFAEFIQIYTTGDRDSLKKDAPEFLGWFEKSFLAEQPKVAEAVTEATKVADTWREQGSIARGVESIIDPAAPKERIKAALQSARSESLITAWIEAAEPIRQMSEKAKSLGEELDPKDDPYVTLSALRTMHSARVKVMVEDGMIDLAGNRTGAALNDIRNLVQGKKTEFTLYLWAKRTLALANDPLRAPRNSGLSVQDAEQIIREHDSTEFQTAAQLVYDWSDGVLTYASQASGSFARVVDKIRESDPGSYVPLQREFEDLDLWSRNQRNLGKGGSISKRLKGSGRRIKDPVQTLIANAEHTVLKAHQRMVLDQIIKLSHLEGMGGLIVEVPVEKVPGGSESIERVLGQISKAAKKALASEAGGEERDRRSGNVAEAIENLRETLSGESLEGFEVGSENSLTNHESDLDITGEMLTFFTESQQPKAGENPILPVWTDGKVKWYELDADLYKTLSSMEVYRLPMLAEMTIGKTTAMFRMGTTGLRASFGLVTNPLRDVQTLYLNTKSHANGFRIFYEWMNMMRDAGLQSVSGGKFGHNEWIETYIRLGGEMAQPLGQDIPHTRRTARRIFQGRTQRIFDPRNAFDFMRDLLQFPEMAARSVELKLVAKEMGWAPGQQMSLDQSFALINSFKQVTTDFTAAGNFARMWNRIAPFHNAAIQGPRAHVRAFRRNPSKFVFRGLQLTAATLALWWRYRDEEWYQELPANEKFMYWHIPVDWPEPTVIRIPRAFEVGAIFAALPEAMAEASAQQNPGMMAEWASHFTKIISPNVTPVLLDEAFDQYANRDRFWDSPIVPMGELRRPEEEQAGEWTTYTARAIGDIFGVSPRRIDHGIRGIFGGVGADVTQGLDEVLRGLDLVPQGTDREAEASDIPVLGALFKRGGKLGTRPASVNRVYEELEKADRIQASQRIEETETQRQQRLQLSDASKALSAISWVRSHTESTKDRRELQQRAVSLARKALKYHEEGKVNRDLFKYERKKAQHEKEQSQ